MIESNPDSRLIVDNKVHRTRRGSGISNFNWGRVFDGGLVVVFGELGMRRRGCHRLIDLHCPRVRSGRAKAIFAGPDPGPLTKYVLIYLIL